MLFLCTGNSCRSQIAEAWTRQLRSDVMEAFSAGTHPAGLDPRAVRVMAEVGVNISGQASTGLEDLEGMAFDHVVTVCAGAHETCPRFPGAAPTLHRGFDDPPHLARGAATEEEALGHYRRVRDEIRAFVETLPGALQDPDRQDQAVRDTVRAGYARIAENEGYGCCSKKSCCASDAGPTAGSLAEVIGYDAEDLATLPEGANMGLSCGNPVALASLRPGEVVVDLGSGGGFDVFVAGRRVGPAGRVIGVDMTPEMVSKARSNIAAYRKASGLDNVEFRLGEIEHLPVEDGTADVIISNCVINLSPDKAQVWRDLTRILKPGGRVAVSDLALVQPLPPGVVEIVEALVGCVAGAVLVEETERMVKAAGLGDIRLEKKADYVNAMSTWKDPLWSKIKDVLPPGSTLGDYVVSLSVSAVKP